jgi:hypothetical protein
MKRINWYLLLGASLLGLSVIAYLVQIAVFRRTTDTFFYLLQDLAFVPIQVLIVTLILNSLLVRREKQAMLKKMEMAIGAFFTEVGTALLGSLAQFDSQDAAMTQAITSNDWSAQGFERAGKYVREHKYQIDSQRGDLAQLKALLLDKRTFMLRLLENPNLLEHESFTDLLLATFHLTEELAFRADLRHLPQADYNHLSTDMKRAYVLLIGEWLVYVKHLQADYPYIFSLLVRTNPFDANASPIFQ